MLDLKYLADNTFILFMLGYIFIYENTQYMFGITNIKECYTNIINRSIKYNVLIVKIMQALTAKHNVLPEIHAVLTENTHNVKYDEEELDQLLLDNICKNYKITLHDNKPFHSGMISVVYLGELDNGKKVVIKMKRNNIANRIKFGSDNVNFIYSLLRTIFACNSKMISQLESLKSITKTQEYLISQCDFGKEIDALITTKEEISQYSICNNVVIPHVYNTEEDIQSAEFIIMEFLEGKFSSEITDDIERKVYYKILCTFMTLHFWYCKYYHTDLHNGNIICINDNGTYKIGIIDFGMNIKINNDIRKILTMVVELNYTTGLENSHLSKYINSILTSPIDINELTKQQTTVLDNCLIELALQMQKGSLNEQVVDNEYRKMANVLTPQFEFVFNIDFILLLLGVSMGNSSAFTLVNHNKQIIEDTMKEVYFEMME